MCLCLWHGALAHADFWKVTLGGCSVAYRRRKKKQQDPMQLKAADQGDPTTTSSPVTETLSKALANNRHLYL